MSPMQCSPDSEQNSFGHWALPLQGVPVTAQVPAMQRLVLTQVLSQSDGTVHGVALTVHRFATQRFSRHSALFTHGAAEMLQVPSGWHRLGTVASTAPSAKWSRISTFGQPSYSAASSGPPKTRVLLRLPVPGTAGNPIAL